MRRRSQLSELNEKQSLIGIIIIVSIIISALILILSKIYLDKTTEPIQQIPSIKIQSDNFPTIQLGHYAMWGRREDGSVLFIKRFNAIENQLRNLDGTDLTELTLEGLEEINKIFVTIENEGDRDEVPNSYILMDSEIIGNMAELKFEVTIPEGDNSFILASPTDGNSTINELSGLWFINANEDIPSLNLPNSPHLFRYETRIINTVNEQILTLGRFENVREEDNSKIYSLNTEGFKYPGEDLLRNLPQPLEAPLNLANGDYKVIVSLEPDVDGNDLTGEDVFLNILSAEIPQDSTEQQNILMQIVYKPIELTIELND